MAKTRRIAELGAGITVHYCSDLREYQVRLAGNPSATYYTDDRGDAFSTGQRMRNDTELARPWADMPRGAA